MASYTPMIQQYLRVKADYQDAFLFFRLGDFYEMFFDDATKASQELEITLTSRDGGGKERIPMCGVPHHSAPNYIEQLIEKGYKVAICEQVEDPKQAKGVVKREVVQLITPGTVMETKGLTDKQNNFITTLTHFREDIFGLAYADLSTGELYTTMLTGPRQLLVNEVYSIGSKEIVVSENFPAEILHSLRERMIITCSYEENSNIPSEFDKITEGIVHDDLLVTIGRLLHYLKRTQKRSLEHIQAAKYYKLEQSMKIDLFSKKNLELTETIRSKGKKGSLLWLLDQTVTAMGGRLLKQWVDRPLINQDEIEKRHQMVETLIKEYFIRQEIRDLLKEVYDLERLAGRVAFGNVNARDLVQLRKSLSQIPLLKSLVEKLPTDNLCLYDQMDVCDELTSLLHESIIEQPSISVKEGNMIKDGFHKELDTYRDARRNGKTWIAELEKKERDLTGIRSLKIGYNRIFGYYIEVTKANISSLPEGRYERKQTLANAERYITEELKEKETLILEAEEKIISLEYELFLKLREEVKVFIPRLQKLAKAVSELDVLQCFATISEERFYTRPTFNDERKIYISEGRHPVVEKVMDSNEYVPNDTWMDKEKEMLLITGPNMSGKSTYMRQVALSAILAQIGCFVPAKEASLPIFDQIFTRIGAADDLVSGQSTFMVEMLEARNAIVYATQNSLILFDEIGRGTSTYDGMALAQALIEYIHDKIGAKTLFSTHYHELTSLETDLHKLKNIHVSVVEQNGKVVFLHKMKDGAADKSYGIHVAELAEMPNELILRAQHILQELENNSVNEKTETSTTNAIEKEDPLTQLSLFEWKEEKRQTDGPLKTEKLVLEKLKQINLLEMTPLEAINKLYELQKHLKK
ncbi:DNA mismatch repair protein MutS [Sutcliffiella rhizosphaerae]|uniref:DNA mismatch repair protein MutS n=1 Tax=Sutcliffiella rhizosphaerae TaxID=2880967 RepID=A0ABM8YPJ9_9BACI|nr:DNA mismatch repair protein MutS [Sutcliffiella rhizosphaerae]CAG9621819.1 DNA mismatch repair protein MutS [Sutcliffiella rhizosphaerae]